MSNPVLLTCGHTSNSVDFLGQPACALCGHSKPAAEPPSLVGRIARCHYGDKNCQSDYGLPFFKLELDNDFDSFYCGCKGWN